VGNAFASRSEREKGHRLGWFSNRFLWIGIGVEILLILLLIYFPPLGIAFQHEPLPAFFWIGLFLYGPILYSLERARKILARKLEAFRIDQEHTL
jgi:Ca2+-transporting ATPase